MDARCKLWPVSVWPLTCQSPDTPAADLFVRRRRLLAAADSNVDRRRRRRQPIVNTDATTSVSATAAATKDTKLWEAVRGGGTFRISILPRMETNIIPRSGVRGANIQTRISTDLPESTGSYRWPIRTSFHPLLTFQSSVGSIHPLHPSLQQVRLSGTICRTMRLQQLLCLHSAGDLNLSVFSLIPGHYTRPIDLSSPTVVRKVIYIAWTTLKMSTDWIYECYYNNNYH